MCRRAGSSSTNSPFRTRDSGLHWYHPHIHGSMARQMFAGLTGAILVEDLPDIADALRDADDRILVLKDITLDGDRVQRHRHLEWPVGKEGELLLVNGVSQPLISARRSLVRLRLLNASNARYWRLRLDQDRPFHVIAEDGYFLDRPVEATEVFLVPGSRAEVLVDMSDGRQATVWYHPSARGGHAFTAVQRLVTIRPPVQPTPVRIPSALGSIDAFDAERHRGAAHDPAVPAQHLQPVLSRGPRGHRRPRRHARDLGGAQRRPHGPHFPSAHLAFPGAWP